MENNTNVTEATMQTETEETTPEDVSTEAIPQAEEAPANGESAEKPFIVRYNHKDRELSREEAVTLAQKGMKYDSMTSVLDDLEYLSAIKEKPLNELLKEYISAEENAHKESIIDMYGDNEEVVDMFMKKYRQETKQKFESAKTTKQKAEEEAEKKAVETLEERIADEFVILKNEFPEVTDVSTVPKSVLKEAENGTHLLDAYLRYKHQEKKRIDAEKQTAASNSKSTAGRMEGGENSDPIMTAFLKGLQR
jgi:hypothetical protein